jgi:membrane protease YdiL (CAAX protease family)
MGVGAFLGRTSGLRTVLVLSEAMLALPSLAALALLGAGLRTALRLHAVTPRAVVASVVLGGTLWALSLGLFELQYVFWKPPAGYLDAFQRLHDLLKPKGPVDALVSYVAIALAPAIFEEIVFRGTLLPSYLRYGGAVAALVSSLLFGLIHLDGTASGAYSLYRVPFAFTVGLGLAAIRVRTGALLPSTIAHATLNAITFTAVPFADPSDGTLPDPRPVVGLLLFAGGALASLFVFLKLLPGVDAAAARPLDSDA